MQLPPTQQLQNTALFTSPQIQAQQAAQSQAQAANAATAANTLAALIHAQLGATNQAHAQNGSLLQGIGARITQLFAISQQVQALANQQRQMDSAEGVGLRQGVRNFDQRMYQAQFALQSAQALGTGMPGANAASQQGSHVTAAEQPSTLEQFGSYAQHYQLEQLQTQLLSYGAEQLGLDVGSLSEMGTTALESMGVDLTSIGSNLGNSGVTLGAEGVGGATSALQSGAQVAQSTLSAAGAAYSGYQMIDTWGESTPEAGAMQGAAMGAYVGSVFPGVGTAIGAVVGAALGGVAGSISSGKHEDQKARDAVRDFFQEAELINEDYELRLADGSGYDIGIDGDNRYPNVDGGSRAPYQVDTSNPLSEQAVGWLDPLTEVMMGGNEKLRADFVGYFSNAVTSNATSIEGMKENVIHLYQQVGLSPEALQQGLSQLLSEEKIDQPRFDAYMNSLRTLLVPNVQ